MLTALLGARKSIPEIAEQMGRSQEAVSGRAWKIGLTNAGAKKPARDQPGPAKKVGDQTPNPLPDDPVDHGGKGGGDAGRMS